MFKISVMKVLLFALVSLLCSTSFAQTGKLSGKVKDATSGDLVVGAKIELSDKYRTRTDYDGNYIIEGVPYGTYTAVVSMLMYDTIRFEVVIDQPEVTKDIDLGNVQVIEEMRVVGNVAQDRKTPVAVSTLDKKTITEELGSQDLPMILNSKPGVHATQQGGGDGDARITIRGFDQRNVGMLIDGVPVNDMENGWVYWSNWFGLDNITQQIQVQRGLGATKIAMPSVGGTMNIITENTAGKREIKVNQEYGSGSFYRTSLSYKSGTLKNGWGILFSGSYKQGDGWVDGLMTQGGFYYLKVQKKIKNHVISLSGFGAPQQHGQRSFNQAIDYWDAQYAHDLGVDTTGAKNWGRRHNQHFGYYTDTDGSRKIKNERLNYYHKPQITLKDFWKVNDKLSWSNMAYMSIGRGGGTRAFNTGAIIYDSLGQIDWDQITFNNQNLTFAGIVVGTTADATYDPTLLKSSQVLTASVNNHMWYGGISQIDYKINDNFDFAAGLDYRYYKGTHYVELRDLLGGDYWVNSKNQNEASPMKKVGDKVGWEDYHNHRDGLVQWMGGFAQVEYSKARWTAFANVSTVTNGYKGIDYFQKKELHIDDTVIYIGAKDTVDYNGKTYTNDSPELIYNQTDWKWLTGFTVKSGANFNITERSNFFMNLGYLDRTPLFNNVIDNNTNTFFKEILNERIMAAELGYGYRSKKVSLNANGYYTYWQNKPFPFGVAIPDPDDPSTFVRANVNGMDALHMGAELDVAYDVTKTLTIEGMASIGDWTWQSSEIVNVLGFEYEFDAKGVHVGDAAQSVFAASARWEFVKRGYVKLKYTYYDRYYSNFDPFSLTGANGGTDSWSIPGYGLMSAHFGYSLKFEKSKLHFRGNVFNVLNTLYISDARNNQNGSGFDAASAGVFMGMGTTFNFSVGFEF